MAFTVFKQMYQEFNKCKNFEHPNIVKYKYFVRKHYKVLGDHEFHLLMEPLSWDMLKYIKYNSRAFHIDQARNVGKNLVKALQYLHDKKRVIHMDLKPQHICFDRYVQKVKIINFGQSTYFSPLAPVTVSDEIDQRTIDKNTKAGGTFRYMSPEQLHGAICPKIDIWAIGCIILYFITGMEPYIGVPEEDVIDMICVRQISPLDHLITTNIEKTDELIGYSQDLLTLLSDCFKFDHTKRPTAK